MPRTSLPAPETMTPDQRKVYDKIVAGKRGRIQGPLRAALHNPDLAERWSALGESIPLRDEPDAAAIRTGDLITGRRAGRRSSGMRTDRRRRRPACRRKSSMPCSRAPARQSMSDEDSACINTRMELNRYDSVSDEDIRTGAGASRRAGVVELTALVGYYTMVAMTLNATRFRSPRA